MQFFLYNNVDAIRLILCNLALKYLALCDMACIASRINIINITSFPTQRIILIFMRNIVTYVDKVVVLQLAASALARAAVDRRLSLEAQQLASVSTCHWYIDRSAIKTCYAILLHSIL